MPENRRYVRSGGEKNGATRIAESGSIQAVGDDEENQFASAEITRPICEFYARRTVTANLGAKEARNSPGQSGAIPQEQTAAL
jgi:hypothetical protein